MINKYGKMKLTKIILSKIPNYSGRCKNKLLALSTSNTSDTYLKLPLNSNLSKENFITYNFKF